MRIVLFMIVLLLLYTLFYSVLGPSITFLIMSGVFLIMGILFSFKKEFYDKCIKFVSPKFYDNFNLKDEKFKERNRKTNIACLYLLSVATFMNSRLCSAISPEFTAKFDFKNILITAIFAFIIYFLSSYIFKKSKSNAQYVIFSVLLGIIAAIIIGILIFRNIEIF
ncbi:MAG TPA: hypothetical protein DCL31_14260 [Clostridium sp.]|nr:hypothetical protein [Clostridium sp.]